MNTYTCSECSCKVLVETVFYFKLQKINVLIWKLIFLSEISLFRIAQNTTYSFLKFLPNLRNRERYIYTHAHLISDFLIPINIFKKMKKRLFMYPRHFLHIHVRTWFTNGTTTWDSRVYISFSGMRERGLCTCQEVK
jgi:hypothetical protein